MLTINTMIYEHVPEGGKKVIRQDLIERVMEVKERIPEDKLAKVRYTTGMTVNLGNFQSANVQVSIELPCHTDKAEETYEEAKDFAGDKLLEEVADLQSLKKKG